MTIIDIILFLLIILCVTWLHKDELKKWLRQIGFFK